MRIAILSTGFCDSTINLVRALAEAGHKVDYFFCWFNKSIREQTCLDIKLSGTKYGGLYGLNSWNTRGISFIENNPNVRLYYFQGFKTGKNSNGLKKWLSQICFHVIMAKLAKFINSQNYDFVDCITQEPLLKDIYKYFKRNRFVYSFHEAFVDHMDKSKGLQTIVYNAIKNGIAVRYFSENSLQEINHLVGMHRSFVIPFGLYYNFKDFSQNGEKTNVFFDKYILFYGYLFPEYKGLSVLFSAIDKLKRNGVIVNVVVAGKGANPSLSMIEKEDNYILKHHFITNKELVNLIENSRFVVCPYLSASQSGVPQTVYVFKKPLVASKVGEFSKMIKDSQTGLLVEPDNVDELAAAIEKLWKDDKLYDDMLKNIERYDTINKEYSWSEIISKYEIMIKTLANES